MQENLELEWAKLAKNAVILRAVSVLWWLLAWLVGFLLSRDLIISLFLSTLCAVLFYRYLTNRLFARQNELKNELLSHFLAQNHAKFTQELPNFHALQGAKMQNGLEFKHFVLCDISFKNAANHAFLGVLIAPKNAKFKENLKSIDENALFEKLKFRGFDASRIYLSPRKNEICGGENGEIQGKNSKNLGYQNAEIYGENSKNDENSSFKNSEIYGENGENLNSKNSENLSPKINKIQSKNSGFKSSEIYSKNAEFALIPSLENPFFINPKFSLKENLNLMQNNFNKIQNLLDF